MSETESHYPSGEQAILPSADEHTIAISTWRPQGPPRAVIQLLHGLGEHKTRYRRFACACNDRDIVLVAHDHRGHGESCKPQDIGHFADLDGWSKLIDDTSRVQKKIVGDFSDVPLILMGHSMGSYIAQSFVMRYPQRRLQALILSASTLRPRLELHAGRLVARIERFRCGSQGNSGLLNKLGFGDFNKPFAPNRSEFDWLSRDVTEVDKYQQDPLCGFAYSCQLWIDLIGGLLEIASRDAVTKVPKELPLLITGGSLDPVGGEAGLTALADLYRKTGHQKVDLKIYADGRHEMLNETNRSAVTADLLDWIDAVPA
jgi:alpha-beta hydrolase superfamily lysophospholipase